MLSHGERARLVFLKMKLLRLNFYLLDDDQPSEAYRGVEDLEEQLERLTRVMRLSVSHIPFFTRTAATRFPRDPQPPGRPTIPTLFDARASAERFTPGPTW